MLRGVEASQESRTNWRTSRNNIEKRQKSAITWGAGPVPAQDPGGEGTVSFDSLISVFSNPAESLRHVILFVTLCIETKYTFPYFVCNFFLFDTLSHMVFNTCLTRVTFPTCFIFGAMRVHMFRTCQYLFRHVQNYIICQYVFIHVS